MTIIRIIILFVIIYAIIKNLKTLLKAAGIIFLILIFTNTLVLLRLYTYIMLSYHFLLNLQLQSSKESKQHKRKRLALFHTKESGQFKCGGIMINRLHWLYVGRQARTIAKCELLTTPYLHTRPSRASW